MDKIINFAVVAHVDAGKSTLVDALLKQNGVFRDNEQVVDCVMDSGDLERERGITITAKNCSIRYKGYKMNIVDTPGHADFSSEIERIIKTVDTVVLLVDSAEGPMPQTRFVLKEALQNGLRPILFINKIDKKDARAEEVVNMTFDLFCELGATNEQLDFKIIYGIAKDGIAKYEENDDNKDITPLGLSSLLLIFLSGCFRSFILVPAFVIRGAGILKVSPYFLLKRIAMSLASSTCCFWSTPTGTKSASQ